MVHFGEFLKTWSLRSNSVTRKVNFNRTKIGGKCQNSSTTFWVIFKQCDMGFLHLFRKVISANCSQMFLFTGSHPNFELSVWRRSTESPLCRNGSPLRASSQIVTNHRAFGRIWYEKYQKGKNLTAKHLVHKKTLGSSKFSLKLTKK